MLFTIFGTYVSQCDLSIFPYRPTMLADIFTKLPTTKKNSDAPATNSDTSVNSLIAST